MTATINPSATDIELSDDWRSWTPAEQDHWAREVRRLAAEKDAVILAHNYQLPMIQDIADHVGDSLALSRLAAASDRGTIVFSAISPTLRTRRLPRWSMSST